jgi:carboxylesterase type B
LFQSKNIKYFLTDFRAGVLHADEIAYVFGLPLDESQGFSEKDKKLSRTMMTFWANFAKTG